jgi:peroxiredoxin
MKYRYSAALVSFCCCVAAGLPAGAATAEAVATPAPAMLGAGAQAPEFSSFDLNGKEVRLADYRGKVLILDFWATWCSPCIASMPHTQEIAAKYADQGVAVLAVCTGDKRTKFADWVKLKGNSYPALRFTFDPHEPGTPTHAQRASVALYGVPAIPAQFILDRSGMIVATTDGYRPGDPRLEAGLAKAGIKIDAAIMTRAAETQARSATVRTAGAATSNPAGARPTPPPFTEDAMRLKAGAVMTDLALRDAAGVEKRISGFRGKPVVLSFSPAESIPSDWLNQAVEKYSAQGVEVVALVTRDTPENFQAWRELHRGRHRFTTLLDPSGPGAVKESAVFLAVGMVVPMPLVLVLDSAGKLLGKVAPKVATSPQGLAELLRRAGVPVKAEDLPTPEMMALVAQFASAAAASTPSTAPAGGAKATLVAPAAATSIAVAATESAADRAYAAFVALRSENPPGKPKEMGGMEKYFAWVDARNKQLTADALAFYAAYPQDPRRWDAVMTLMGRAPIFMKGFAPKPGTTNQSIADVIFDEPAKQAWQTQVDALKQAVLAAADSKPEQREMIEFQDFAAESRRQRARIKSGEEKDARAAWLALIARFDRHVTRYAGNPRLAGEAENFLTAWKDTVPGALEEGCRHLLTAPDAGVKKFATEKLQALDSLARPLELAFTAVDGRRVDLKDLRGKVVLVDFWATWCGPCIAELPNIKKVYAELHAKGFEIIGVTLENASLMANDTPEQAAAKLAKAKQKLVDFTTKEQMPWPQHFDGKYWKNEFSTKFGISLIPSMFLIDQAGRVVSTNARGEALEREVRRLLKL